MMPYMATNDSIKERKIKELLERGVEEVIVRKELEEKLRSGKKLRVKFGIDPTAPEMHLGHLVPLRKLAAFQRLGHTVVFIIGDFTAMIGDPTGRNELRKPLTHEETRKNATDYLNEAGKIFDLKKTEVHFNSEWLDPLGIAGIFKLASKVTVQRALERDDFQKRLKQDQDVSLLETLYPLLQGYDSVAIRSDLEIGGTDQKFNLLMGRRVQRRYDIGEQQIMTLWLIEGTDGVRKMSKSYGNYISLRDLPKDIFGKVMSIPDELIIKYLVALSDTPYSEVEKLRAIWQNDRQNFPARDTKMLLAAEMVALCYSKSEAEKAQQQFINVVQKGELPADIPEKKLSKKEYWICDLLVEVGLASSKGEARRLVEGGGVSVANQKMLDPFEKISIPKKAMLIKVGKRHFMKVHASNSA